VTFSGDPEQEYFADGMVEEIITALSAIWGLLRILERFSAWPFAVYRRVACFMPDLMMPPPPADYRGAGAI
jgi:undecaprenyl pyrophosphate phosphatase UppP